MCHFQEWQFVAHFIRIKIGTIIYFFLFPYVMYINREWKGVGPFNHEL